jgi:hypothetical protein
MPRKVNRNELPEIRVKVNGKYQGSVKTGTEVLGYMLSLGMEDLKYFSEDAIINWIRESLELANEVLEWKTDPSLRKRLEIYNKSLSKINNRESAMNLFVNIAMSCEGLGTLSGFGMANVESNEGRMKSKGKLLINPEKRSIY